MAFSLGGSSGGMRGRRRHGASYGALSEINVVPLVDVVLVLLIIFMLTAHVMDYGMEVEVPKTKVTQQTNEVLPVITITGDQRLELNKKPVKLLELRAQLEQRFKGQKNVYVAADSSVRWDILANVVAELSDAHITPKLVTRPLDSGGK